MRPNRYNSAGRGATIATTSTMIAAMAAGIFASIAVAAPAEIQVLSNRADLISGGEALVEIKWPAGAPVAFAKIAVDGVNVNSMFALIPLMLVFGGANGLFDVSINAEGTVLEAQSGKRVMSNFHGMYSVGGMVGAGVGALLIAADVAPALQLAGLGAVLAILVAGASVFMLPVHPKDPEHQSTNSLPRGTLAVMGVLAAVGLLAEGAMYDWSVLYMQTETGALPALAALGYASFSAAMAATRFVGDTLRAHMSAQRLMAASGALAAVGMATALLVRDPIVALIGFAFVGIGFANVVPILFIGATKVPGVAPAAAIATVSSVGYLGFVAGPPLVGGIAHSLSLSWALGVVVIGGLLLAWGARRIPA